MELLKKLVHIIIFILFLGILIVNIASLNIISLILTIILILILIWIPKKYKEYLLKNRIIKYGIIILGILSIIIRIILINKLDFIVTSDFELYYNTAKEIIAGNITNKYYLSFNGYVYFFSYILSLIFRIFGTSIKVALYFNIFCQILTAFLLYKLLHLKNDRLISIYGSILWLLLPTVFFATFLISTENLFLLCFIITLYLFYILIEKRNVNFKNIILFLIIGILISISNNIRPIMIIFIIATIIYFILTSKKIKEYILLIFLLLGYFGTNNIINNWIEKKYDTTMQSGALEWSIYFGSNYELCGGWSEEDSNYAFNVIKNEGSGELLKDAFNRFWNLKTSQKITLGMCKYYNLWSDSNSTYVFFDLVTNNNNQKYKLVFDQISKIIVIIIILYVMISIIYDIKKKKYDNIFLEIFIIGYILANLLIVVNGRYNYILYPLLLLLIKKRNENNMKEKISKLVNVYKKYGFIGFCKKLRAYIIANYLDKISFKVIFNKKKYRNEIKNILKNNKYERIILWRSSFGYNVPLFQRPQHIANNLAKNNCLVFYEVTTMTDNIKTIKELKKNIYLINFNNMALNKILMQELSNIKKPKYIQLYSTDWKLSVENIENYINNGYKFIYEYIDDLSPELAGTKNIPQNIIDKYNYVMNHKNVYVVVTADALEKEVIKHRGKENLAFSSNGVDYDFYKTFDKDYKFEKEFQDIINKKKPIVMYYGALAKWFDYDLIKKIAKTNNYSIVLFGIKYDEAYDQNMNNEENIYFLGSRDYKVLKNYAKYADVLTIPFVINNITLATSPVKIFEYMALHKPIITTDMPECRKYKSVFIAKTHDEFINNIEKALKKEKDKKYIELLDKEAKENDWKMKAKAIIDLIKKDEKK